MQPRVIIPLLYDYYIFEYLRPLIRALAARGFEVTVAVFRAGDADAYRVLPCQLVTAPRLLRACNVRSNRVLLRLLLWIGAWMWARRLRNRYDAALLPSDTRPVWYAIGRTMPAVTCHVASSFYDYSGVLEFERWQSRRRSRWQRCAHRALGAWERVTGLRVLPRVGGVVTRYRSPAVVVLDRCMGFRSENYLGDFSGPIHRTVTGTRMKEVLVQLGADAERVHVVGHPGFDDLFGLRTSFDDAARRAFRDAEGFPSQARAFLFFLSPSSFTAAQLQEVITVVERIFVHDPRAFIVVKFHPKTVPESIAALTSALAAHGDAVAFRTAFLGDVYNARLMLAADVLVQKQCSLGFLAMMYEHPMISYNLVATDYEDDMYRILDASIHVESVAELDRALVAIESPAVVHALRMRQRRACERFCLATDAAASGVATILHSLVPRTACA